ncbi:MAG: hypothetical protein OXO52_01040 [Rhodospirillales bacterium]|nr:hypothetical protein [Rhodospirillales bacterium]MDE0379508.1 hypothetical protein [Rhodospirillales bacterium]
MTAAAKLIRGGQVFRAAERDFAPADILVEGERIRAVGADLPAPDGVEVLDVLNHANPWRNYGAR